MSDSLTLVKPTYKILSNFRLKTRSWLYFPRHKNKKKSPHQNLQDRIELKIWNFAYRLKLIRLRSKAFQKFSAQKNFGSKKMLSQRKFLVKKNLVKNCLVKNMVPRRSKLWEKVHWPIWRLHTKSRLPAMLRILQKVFNICPSDKGRRQKKKNGKISDIVQNSNYPLPPCPNNDEWKNDKSQQSIGPSLLKEIMTN